MRYPLLSQLPAISFRSIMPVISAAIFCKKKPSVIQIWKTEGYIAKGKFTNIVAHALSVGDNVFHALFNRLQQVAYIHTCYYLCTAVTMPTFILNNINTLSKNCITH